MQSFFNTCSAQNFIMGYRPQIRGSRGSGRGQQSQHERAKARRERHRPKDKYAPEESKTTTPEEIGQKTIAGLKQLGAQHFAVSPFSQYFDDWLVNLKNVVAEFESNPVIAADQRFVEKREEIFSKITLELEEQRRKEADLEKLHKRRSEENHRMVESDVEYAAKTRELGAKRNAEIQRLSERVHDFEHDLEQAHRIKTSIFGWSKKAKAQKEAEATAKLNAAKEQLEKTVKNFTVEQEKLHDDYEKKKQEIISEVRNLDSEIEVLETDGSAELRRQACEALAGIVNEVLERKAVSG